MTDTTPQPDTRSPWLIHLETLVREYGDAVLVANVTPERSKMERTRSYARVHLARDAVLEHGAYMERAYVKADERSQARS